MATDTAVLLGFLLGIVAMSIWNRAFNPPPPPPPPPPPQFPPAA